MKYMKYICSLSLFLCAIGMPSRASAILIDGWDFAGLAATTPSSATPAIISATVGTGSLDVSAFGLGSPQGTNPERTSFSGSTLNAFPGSSDGNPGTALALANQSANGSAIIFSFTMAGYQSLIVSFAARGTSTGFDTGTWAWSTDNLNYTTLSGVNTATRNTTFAVATVDFSSAPGLNDAPTAYLRYTLSGATSASGNNRLDNIQFNAASVTSVPDSPSVAVTALAGLTGVIGVLLRKRWNPSLR